MATRTYFAIILAAALFFVSTGLAAAQGADAPRSIWGADNPGQGAWHSAKPLAGVEHNNADASHEDNRGGNDDGDA